MSGSGATIENPLATASPTEVRRLFRILLRGRAGDLGAVGALFLLAAVAGLGLPLGLGAIVDAVAAGDAVHTVMGWVGVTAVTSIAAALLGLWGARRLITLVQATLAQLRENVFADALQLPVATIDRSESADLISRVTGDVEAVAEAGSEVVPGLLSALFTITVSLASLTVIDARLALAGLVCVPCYVFGARWFLRRSRVVFREVREREAHRSQAVLEAVEGRETLIALNEQPGALHRVATRAEASIESQVMGTRVRNRLYLAIHGGEALGMIALLAAGAVLSSLGELSVGMVTAAALVFHRLFGPIGQLIFSLDDVQRATVGLARLVGVIVTAETQASAQDIQTLDAGGAAIAVNSVSYRYEGSGRGVHGVTLTVAQGTTTALVGASGSGKSTLAKLIAGQYSPDEGDIALAAGSVVYTISQDIHWFKGGVAANLRLGRPEASDEELEEVLRSVGAAWAVQALDDLTIEPDEGRIQQIAIARAMLANPDIVILDEPTADVGLQHREAVETAIATLRKNRTVVTIAHRLAPVIDAEQIVVCASGSIVQGGTHGELVREPGLYRDLWRAQTRRA